MDALSKVLDLARIKGSLDLRCQLAGSFALDHEPTVPGEHGKYPIPTPGVTEMIDDKI